MSDELLAFVRACLDREEQDAAHIAMQDPAHTLARIASDRKILALHDREFSRGPDQLPIPGARLALTRVIQLMAQRYAGWPGWREEWQVSVGA